MSQLNNIYKWLNTHSNHLQAIFLIALFLIRIPPFYLIPMIKSSFLTSHTLARLVVGFLFLIVFLVHQKNNILINAKSRRLLVVYLGYFSILSFSIINAVNVLAFFQRYKDIFSAGLFLFVLVYLKVDSKKIFYVLLASLVVNFFYQLIMFFFPSFFELFLSNFLYASHFELVNINLNRGRIFIETYDEIVFSLLAVYFLFDSSNKNSWKYFIFFGLMVILPSLFSNFRSRILMLGVGILGGIYIMREKLSKLFLMISMMILAVFVSAAALDFFVGFSFFDRLMMKDKIEDVDTISFRVSNIKHSSDLAWAFPTGVGLGNYYEYLPSSKSTGLSFYNWKNVEARIASTNPHNIFAQIASNAGLLGLFYYVAMIVWFGYSDVRSLMRKSYISMAWIFSFWTLFSYSLFNPSTTMTYNALFWILRGVIANESDN